MKTSSNNNNIESKKVQLDDPKGKVNGVNNTLPAWCKNGQHVLFEGKLHVIECAPKKEYEHLHEVIIEDCETHHCHFENWDNLTPCTPDGRELLPEPPKEIIIEDATLEPASEITDENEAARALAGKEAHFVISDKDGRETLKHSFTFKDSFRNQANRIWIDVKEKGDVIGRWLMLKYDVIKELANTGRVVVSHPDGERHCITLA